METQAPLSSDAIMRGGLTGHPTPGRLWALKAHDLGENEAKRIKPLVNHSGVGH